MSRVDREEKELLDSYGRGEWRPTKKLRLEDYKAYAKATLKKDKRLNIRMASKDLVGIQRIAIEEGLPYQTLIASVLHKYVAKRYKFQEEYV